jgi:hypothetical protein
METTVKTVDQMTTKELEVYLAERKKEQIAEMNRKRAEYEKYVEQNTSRLVRKAIKLNTILTTFFANSTTILKKCAKS